MPIPSMRYALLSLAAILGALLWGALELCALQWSRLGWRAPDSKSPRTSEGA